MKTELRCRFATDELALLKAVYQHKTDLTLPRQSAEQIGDSLNISPKRLNALLQNWTNKGWWCYPDTPRAGWITDKGIAAARATMEAYAAQQKGGGA